MLDALQTLIEYDGVFTERNTLFVSTTGKLLNGYVNCEVAYPHFPVVDDLTRQLIEPFLDEVEGFICPATGDIVLAQYATNIANSLGKPTTAVWADKRGSGADSSYHVERNGFEAAIAGKRVLVLNDRISQGGTTLKVIAEAERLGCDVLGVATLAGVSAATPEFLGVPRVHALCTVDVRAFPDTEIPEEYEGWPIAIDDALGHGADYKVDHPDYAGGFVELLAA